ncbi:MAG: type II toxin-antitoxin system RelE/ParE family toxin [Megasphaera sp.]|uniref:type II toxin-antitoxin system RelE/ParE family toxin n=1 Tax=Megasphaera TaxID=906 RepID=UPI003520FFAE
MLLITADLKYVFLSVKEEDIWELRPGNNRVFYFYYDESQYVLLHHFRKKSQETPGGRSWLTRIKMQ